MEEEGPRVFNIQCLFLNKDKNFDYKIRRIYKQMFSSGVRSADVIGLFAQ